jgi:FkbM family methyltransferase
MKLKSVFYRCVRRPLQKIGVRICAAHKFPICTGSLLDLAIPAFLPKFQDFVVCQVGASDGKTSDPLAHLIRNYDLRGILIEPLTTSFKLLAEKYRGSERIVCVNCAISNTEGLISFFRPNENGKSDISDSQKSGMSKQALLKAGILEADIEEIVVTSKTLAQIMNEQGLERIDLLQIDTEGFDYEIVKQALNLPSPPPIIHFETIHLSRSDKLSSREYLSAKGYSLIESETDTLAYQLGFLQ